MVVEFAASDRTRFPLFSSTATVLFVVVMLARHDQRTDWLARLKITKSPSSRIVSSDEAPSASGLPRLATHAGVSFGTELNHTPKYHLGAEVVVLPVVWKNPSANLPLSETSLSPPTSGRPAETVSAAAHVEATEMIRTDKSSSSRTGGMARAVATMLEALNCLVNWHWQRLSVNGEAARW